jgi:hypothetical protein
MHSHEFTRLTGEELTGFLRITGIAGTHAKAEELAGTIRNLPLNPGSDYSGQKLASREYTIYRTGEDSYRVLY